MLPPPLPHGKWQNTNTIGSNSYTCAYCEHLVAPDQGYFFALSDNTRLPIHIYICSGCKNPTFFHGPFQVPGVPFGRPVGSLTKDVETLYNEARGSAAAGSHTGAVLLCRKILSHVAVDQGAPTGQTFQVYVDYLASNGYVPPKCKHLVDHIRKRGNDANHQIVLMNEDDSRELINFLEMLLKFIYEFPNMTPRATPE